LQAGESDSGETARLSKAGGTCQNDNDRSCQDVDAYKDRIVSRLALRNQAQEFSAGRSKAEPPSRRLRFFSLLLFDQAGWELL
jgi:hypothetical protein